METFKLEVKRTVIDNVEMRLPIHRMNVCYAYKVISQTKCISVLHGLEYSAQINITYPSMAWLDDATKDCTEDEFLDAYEKTLKSINEAIFSVEV